MDSPKYSQFNVSRTTYKTVNGHDLATYILVPKNCPPGKRPIYVKFHGGFLVLGAALYPDWTPTWALTYILSHNAILIAPNYRLMPEASGSEILSDISDFWAWLSSSLPTYLSQNHPGIEPDLERICCTGESAGGYLAVMSALAQAEGVKGGIRALIAAYPMLDVGADFFSKNLGTQHPLGVPTLPAEVLESHLGDMKEGHVVSEVEPPERFQLAVGMVQQGRWTEFLGEGAGLFPMKVIEEVQEVPFMFLFHGRDDSAVPVEGTEKFAEKAKVRFGEEKVLLYTAPGEHGFDGEVGVETSWMEEGLVKVTRAWLGSE